MTSSSGISLVLPAFNEEPNIATAIGEAWAALTQMTMKFEIIIVDDGSTDGTYATAVREAQRLEHVRVLSLPENSGYGAALSAGFAAARLELVGFTDADCQFDLTDLDLLVRLCRDHEIACGYRINRKDTALRRIYSRVYNGLVRSFLHIQVRDCDCALKIFRREALQKLVIEARGFFINAEILARARMAGMSVAEVGVRHRPRLGGVSKVSVMDVIPSLASLLRFWWRAVRFPGPALQPPRGNASPMVAWLLLLLAAGLLAVNLSFPLFAPDETRNTGIAIEMLESGDWVVPRLNHKDYLDKPPMLYWLTALSVASFGETATAERLPIALAALLTVAATAILGRRIVGLRAATVAAVLLLGSAGFTLAGRFLVTDALLVLFTTISFLAGYLGIGNGRYRMGWWAVAGCAMGLGVLTKGPVVLVLCLPPLLLHRWLWGSASVVGPKQWSVLALPVILITAPWVVEVALARPAFFSHFFWLHNVVRFVSSFDHQEAWWYYLPGIFLVMAPASLLLPVFLRYLFHADPEVRRTRGPEVAYLVLAAAWVVLFFSLSATKLLTYILPAVPVLCLAMGKLFGSNRAGAYVVDSIAPRCARWGTGTACAIVSIMAGVAIILIPFNSSAAQLVDWIFLFAGLAGILAVLLRWPGWKPWLVTAVVSLGYVFFVTDIVVPQIAHSKVMEAASMHLDQPVTAWKRSPADGPRQGSQLLAGGSAAPGP